MRTSHKIATAILTVLLWLVPSVILAQGRHVNAFLWGALSRVADMQAGVSFQDPSTSLSTYTMLLYQISTIAGISPEQLAYLPLGALFTPLLIFIVARRLLRSNLLALLLAMYVAYDFTLASSHYNTFAYAWTRPMFLTFLFLFVMYVKRTPENSVAFPGLLLVLFLSVYFFHPTYTFWLLLLVGGTALAVVVSRELKVRAVSLRTAGSLSLSLFVFYLGFNELFYNVLLGRAILANPEAISAELLQIVRSLLGLGVSATAPYTLAAPPPTAVIGYAILLRTILILSVLLVVLILWLIKYRVRLRAAVDDNALLMAALLAVGVGHAVGYALYGHVSLRFIILMFPLVALMAMRKLGLRRTGLAFAGGLVILAVVQTGSFALQVELNSSPIDQLTPPSLWLTTHGPLSPSILSDFESLQILQFRFQEQGQTLLQQFIDSDIYGTLVSGDARLNAVDYVIVNLRASITWSPGWLVFEPLAKYGEQIDGNVFLNKIYDHGGVWILSP